MADQDKDDLNQEPSFLDMSDDEMANMAAPSMVSTPAGEATDPVDPAPAGDDANTDPAPAGEEGVDPAATPGAGDEKQEDGETADAANGAEAPKGNADKDDAGKENDPADPAKADPAKPADPVVEIDYKAEYEKLLAPFKANGRDMQVKDVDDALTLMKMGANYNKKMAALKPNLRMMRMLQENELLDEANISFLIDLAKKKPEAISKLVQESGIDPLDISADKAGEYKPSTYTVDERIMELDEVLEGLRESPGYNRTLEVVGTKWDAASKEAIVKFPGVIEIINGHVESGIYDLIAAEVENERTFGRLKGMSDLDAYQAIGDKLNAQGRFNHLVKPQAAKVDAPAAPAVIAPKPPKAADPDLNQKRRAASSTKSTAAPASAVPADFNPLSLPDDELAAFNFR